jgi:arylsulfatase A-like enzyme
MKAKLLIALSTVIIICLIGIGFICLREDNLRQPKNVVIISIDTCRADLLGCYGYPRNISPNIDKVAKDGILFENTFTPIATTLPAHSSMFTGTIPPYHGIHDNDGYVLDESAVTLAEMLKQNGFNTSAFVSAFVLDSQFGLDQGFDLYDDNFGKTHNSMGINERLGGETNARALDWLDKNHKEKFFLFLHYFDPHFTYNAPPPFESNMRKAFKDFKLQLDQTQKEYLELVIQYAAEISYTDYCIGKVIEKLKSLDLYDSTLLIITADHGESLHEHGEKSHAYFAYQSTIAVPLVFKLPGGPKAMRITDNVGLAECAE